jgi:WD40 repeat protein
MRQGRIHALLTDVDRLLLAYNTPITESALHVYHSALATMPSCLLWKEAAPHDGHGIPMLVTKRAPGWGVRETILEAESFPVCIAYAPHGKLIASISFRPVIEVWDVETGTTLHIMSVPEVEVDAGSAFISIAFSPNGQWIASASDDCTVRLWDVVTGSQRHVMRGHTNSVSCVAFSPNGATIASGSDDGTLRIWDVGTSAEQWVMIGHTAAVNSLAFAPDGQTIVSASSDGTLQVWDVRVGTKQSIIEVAEGVLYCVAFSPDGATIASGSANGNLQLWSTINSTRQHALKGHFDSVQSFAFSPDGRSILSCDAFGSARTWDVTTGIEKHRLRENVSVVAYSPDGKSIAMGLQTGTIRIWDANISVGDVAHPIPEGHNSASIDSVTFSPDGVLIAFSCADQTVRIWDATTATERLVIEAGYTIRSLTFSPDNRTIACGQSNGAVQLRDVTSGQKKCYMMGQHATEVDSLAFSPDGKFIVSYSSSNGIAQVWDEATGAEQHLLTRRDASNRGWYNIMIAFSDNGKAIILLTGIVARGFWDLTSTRPEYVESTPHEQTPASDNFHGSKQHHFNGGSSWIWCSVGDEGLCDLCWLPPERRGVFAYNGTRVCTSGQNGTITILDFLHVDILQHGV